MGWSRQTWRQDTDAGTVFEMHGMNLLHATPVGMTLGPDVIFGELICLTRGFLHAAVSDLAQVGVTLGRDSTDSLHWLA